MEKLKYFAMALLVAVSAGFVSCSDDDEAGANEYNNLSIGGTWLTGATDNPPYYQLVFGGDGNFAWTHVKTQYSTGEAIWGTYKVNPDKSTVELVWDPTEGVEGESTYIYSLSQDRLSMENIMTAETYVFYRMSHFE